MRRRLRLPREMDEPMLAMQLTGRETRRKPGVATTLLAAARTPGADGIAKVVAVEAAAAAEGQTEVTTIMPSISSSRT